MTEDELIALIASRAKPDARVSVGIGDDAAVLEDGLTLSVDAVVEGVHFERAWLSLLDIGYRGTVAALSDLAAMGARPLAVLSSLTLPSGEPGAEVMAGVSEAADEYGACLVGGNVSRGRELALHTTVIGRCDGPPWLRAGARPGDAVYVSGTLGSAALGWRLLARGLERAPFTSRWRRPRARFDLEGRIAPSACVDVSDGLVSDLGHICEASRLGARVELASVPVDEGFASAAEEVEASSDDLALGGGEDYELLFTAPPGSVDASTATDIGRIVEGAGVVVIGQDGDVVHHPFGGHRHF